MEVSYTEEQRRIAELEAEVERLTQNLADQDLLDRVAALESAYPILKVAVGGLRDDVRILKFKEPKL